MKQLVIIVLISAAVLFGIHQLASVGLDALDDAARVREQAKLRTQSLNDELAGIRTKPLTAPTPADHSSTEPLSTAAMPAVAATPAQPQIAIGDEVATVLRRCGQPVRQSRDGAYAWWHYAEGRVILHDGVVTGWYGVLPNINRDR